MEKDTNLQPTPQEGANTAENTPSLPQETPSPKADKPKLDTETSFADMNVEGFRWYNPNKKKGKADKVQLSRKEYWAMVRGAFAAMLPMILCMFLSMGIVFLLAYLWLKP